ncbi:hypothetical protein ACQUFD_17515, partial [Enterococcus gallinarum]|uniref:hypothetical protein n=1 Tax=Enterococcus gallinarum TaxID=1353 RepID=UPI003D0FFC36
LRMTGSASGTLVASSTSSLKGMQAELKLDAPSLTIQGVPAGSVAINLREKDDVLVYEATADGPEGKVRLNGTLPLNGPPKSPTANAE